MTGHYEMKVQGIKVKPRVIDTEIALKTGIEDLWSFVGKGTGSKYVVGLDIECTAVESTNKVSILKLATGSFCLIIRLLNLGTIPHFLFNFLRLPDVSFVGVGIKENVAMLERDYGLQCRNMVDLRFLASSVFDDRRLVGYGLVDLAYHVIPLQVMKKPASVFLSDWNGENLTMEEIEFATIDAYASYKIGNKLLGGL
ncbi:exonuclease 3'-5' domain-containing protein 2-like [Telopea speciosissima]|uniref:exonuclease 3'-5' domain-containing protein 2-like n=1 Tax=Telopea speciosissima TaxID=54955 RepID=UPI001CC81A37|nr:exonuclease 3'-5' domain-containing protein 2-like [Telopea speciosissima]